MVKLGVFLAASVEAHKQNFLLQALLQPAVPIHTSNLFSCTQAKFCSIPQCIPWDLDFFSLSFFPPSPHPSFGAHLSTPSTSRRRCLCGCNFHPAQLWDLLSARTSAQEWMNAPTCICLIITRDVIRIIHVMTARRIGSCAQSQPQTPTDFGNAWI